MLLVTLTAVAVGLACIIRQPLKLLVLAVDWNTISTLTGLLLITTAVKESGLFYVLAYRIARKISNERLLVLSLVFLAALLSMFLTNDIALFILVPLTLTLQQIIRRDYSRLVFFEAIAVNVGSSLTPIGNPQNIYLWHQWGISFYSFVKEMFPLVCTMFFWLVTMSVLCFESKRIRLTDNYNYTVDRKLFVMSTILLVGFVASVELGYKLYLLPVIFMSVLTVRRDVLLRCDWELIFLFIVIFVDIDLISQFRLVTHLLNVLDFNNAKTLFLSGALFSQCISNVPAAILLAKHTNNFKMIAYGVNVGGNGIVIGSFANLIALHFLKRKTDYLSFHLYSLPYFVATLFSCLYLLIY